MMVKQGMRWLGWGSVLILFGCTQVDDYFLGKDNTPQPEALSSITHQVKFKPLWMVKLGGHRQGEHDKLMPVVRDRVLYVALSHGIVQARSIKTGALRWSQKINSGCTAGPALGHDILALGTRASSVVVLNQRDGQVLWEKKLSGELLSQPAIAEGKVFVKTVDGNVYAFNAHDGKRLWRYQHGSPELILKASSSPVALPHHWLLVGFPDGKLDAIDSRTGQIIWEKNIVFSKGSSEVERLIDIDADPILYQRSVLIGTYQGFVGAMSLENGEFIWQKPLSVYKNMAVGRGTLYVSDENDVIWSFQPDQGQINWKQDKLKVRGLTSPAWSSQGILVGDRMGWLHVLASQDGTLIGRVKLNGAVLAPVVVMGNLVIVQSQSGQLYAFELMRGERV